MEPTRKPISHKGSFSGMFPSIKMDKMIGFESGLERDFIYLLEYDARVKSYCEQPEKIRYEYGGNKHHYTPDFSAIMDDKKWLYECKPDKYVNSPVNQIKFKAGEKWCEEHGYTFKVVTPKEILAGCRLENIKHLWKFSRLEYDSDVLTNILNYLLKIKSEKLLSVVNHFPTTPSRTMYSHLFYLIYHHKLKVEMNLHYISPNSEVYIDL